MDLRSGIIETANAIGLPPEDLATIISYESGFRPDVWGGAGGKYYGLIQFGPAERQQYGVRVGDVTSQLGANGAIARFFRDRGFKPGMGLLDAYSTVNAGRPGLYNRSDAAAGGQPGTVRDKVTQQFGPHRKRAMAMLGGTYSPPGGPSPAGPTGQSPYALAAAARNQPRTGKQKIGDALVGAMEGFGGGAGGAGVYQPELEQMPEAARVDAPAAPIFDTRQADANRQRLSEILARLNQPQGSVA